MFSSLFGTHAGGSKADKKAERAAKRAAEQAAAAAKKEAEARANDPLGHNYGDKPLIRSEKHNETVFTTIGSLDPSLKDKTVATRARLHAGLRSTLKTSITGLSSTNERFDVHC